MRSQGNRPFLAEQARGNEGRGKETIKSSASWLLLNSSSEPASMLDDDSERTPVNNLRREIGGDELTERRTN